MGDSFSNTANIYFDYNFPIVTNTATTTITALGNQDFEFTNLFSLSPVPAKNSLTITTKQNVTISSVSIYNTLGQLVQVNTNPNETIDVSELKAGIILSRLLVIKERRVLSL
ncbi:T9SS type A sorting domain-containing protein [Flavobacterium paronense]|uniref:T9SS type A sorting domain-containing protein n=1 Tax=Flavobacterium paronense TaxID=1392775 RepID=UPI003F6A586B